MPNSPVKLQVVRIYDVLQDWSTLEHATQLAQPGHIHAELR